MPEQSPEWVMTGYRLNVELFNKINEYMEWMGSDEGLKIGRPTRHDAVSRLLRLALESESNVNDSYRDYIANRHNS